MWATCGSTVRSVFWPADMIIVLDHKDVNLTIILVLEQQLVVFSQALHAGMHLGAACVTHVVCEDRVAHATLAEAQRGLSD